LALRYRPCAKSQEASTASVFLQDLPHNYYDENMLHSILLSNEKDFDECILQIERFLPYIDNWAVCDTLHPQVFAKHSKEVLTYADKWIKDTHTYTIRFGIKAFMTELLDGDFKEEYLETVANVKNDDYYVKMAVAWYFATALAKQWDSAVKLLQNGRLDAWTHNKAIQKARESFRITKAQKEYLNTLKK